MPPNWPDRRVIAHLVADLAGVAAERIVLDRVIEARARENDEAELAAVGIGLRHDVAFENDVVRRMKAECARRIGIGRRSEHRVVGDVPGPAEDFDRSPLEGRVRDRPAVCVVGSDQIDVLLADVLMRRIA